MKPKYLPITKSLFLFVILLTVFSGCKSDTPATEAAKVQLPTTESTEPTFAETVPVAEKTLTKERDSTKLSLRFQPTREVTSGEDAWYYAPSDQDTWISILEIAQSKADPNQRWQPSDSSMGIWICYQNDWWELLVSGELLSYGSGRIASADAVQIYEMCMAAANEWNLSKPVRPAQIRNIKSATLDYEGSHTITDARKLQTLEIWLSNSRELSGGAQCWFTAFLTLTLENDEVYTISMATDSCCTWMSEGVYYDYGSFDNAEFFALFESAEDAPAVYSPEKTDFVRISDYIPNVDVALDYAIAENFTGRVIYGFSDAWLRYGTVQKLMQVSEELKVHGLTLRIWDAYRPLSGQARLWEACPDPRYVSPPDTGNRTHCRGSAVDVTLLGQDGNELEMPSGFDEFSPFGDRDYSDCSDTAAANAELLQKVMEKYGFEGYSGEWWHFTDSDTYPIEETFLPVSPYWCYADCNEFITLRSGASTSAEALLRIPAGEEIQVLAEDGDFAFISYNDLQGYVLRSYIQPVGDGL